jgi:hypothetical protein
VVRSTSSIYILSKRKKMYDRHLKGNFKIVLFLKGGRVSIWAGGGKSDNNTILNFYKNEIKIF